MAIFEAYPQELSHLKSLLLRNQYHQCINVSSGLLTSLEAGGDYHPLLRMFATFYLAIANDELARSMHEHSSFKIATFDTAERHYRQAMKLLPNLEQCRGILKQSYQEKALGEATRSSPPASPGTQALAHPHPTHDKSIERNISDLESRDSFDSFPPIGTAGPSLIPRRTLERDYSSMSLLSVNPKLTKSTSQGLLRPIRLGSPPKAYHLPPKLPYFGKDHSNQPSRSPSQQSNVYDTCTTESAMPTPTEPSFSDLTNLEEQLDGMRMQIKTLVDLLRRAKLATLNAQAERTARFNTTKRSPQMSIPSSKSFWSFTPANVKLAEKQKKIEEGRARGWQRKRYNPERFEALIGDAYALF